MSDHPHARWDIPPPHLLELIYETMSDGVAVFDTVGRVAYCNPAMCLLVGRPVDDIVGKTGAEAWGAPGSELSRSMVMTTVEERIRRPDGSEKLVTAKSFALTSSPPLQVHIYRDVTKIREARRALEDSYKVFHAFMANNPAAATIKDGDGKYIYVNPPAEELLGRAAKEWAGKSDDDLWPSDVARMIRRNDEAVRRTRQTLQFEESLPTVAGVRHFHTHRFLITDSHEQSLLASTSLDISDLTAREEEIAQRDQVLQSLLEIMATLSSTSTQDLRRVLILLGNAIESTCTTIAVRKGAEILDVIQHHWYSTSVPGTRTQPRWELSEKEVHLLMGDLARGEVLHIEDVVELTAEQSTEIARLHGGDTTAFLAAPIMGDRHTFLGFVAIDDHRQSREWTEIESQALQAVARMLASNFPHR